MTLPPCLFGAEKPDERRFFENEYQKRAAASCAI